MAKRQDLHHQLKFVSSRIACEVLGVTAQTMRRWAKTGKIGAIKTPGGQYRYDLSGLIVSATPAVPPQPKPKAEKAARTGETGKPAPAVIPPAGKNLPVQLDLVEMVKATPPPAVISAEALRHQIERLASASSW
jgi:excisionase family DNA binding protein